VHQVLGQQGRRDRGRLARPGGATSTALLPTRNAASRSGSTAWIGKVSVIARNQFPEAGFGASEG
jgi:hypothetical protein